MKNLEQLKKQLQKALGIIDYQLSNEEIQEISKNIKLVPYDERNEARIQKIVTKVTGIKRFWTMEGLDLSDIDYIIAQIEDALKNK